MAQTSLSVIQKCNYFGFLWMRWGGQWCNTKYFLLMSCGTLKMARPYNCRKKMPQDGQNYWRGFRILFHFAQYGGMMNWRQVSKKGSLVARFQSILNFGSLGCQKTICILELWVLMWIIGRTFWNCYQDLSHGRVLFCWKAFGFLTIRKLFMNMHPFIPLLMLTLKILSSFHIWV
jgi:hypothetical protein